MPQPNNSLNQFLAEFTAKTAYDTYSSEREQYQKTQQPGYKGPSYVDNLLLNRIPTELVQPENVAMEAGIATGGLGLAFLLKRFGPNALKGIKNMIGKPVSSADDLSRSQANLNRAQLQQPKDFDNLAPSYNDYINNLKTGKAPLRDYQNLDFGSQRLIFKDGKVIKRAQSNNRADYSGLPQNKFGGYEGRVSDKNLPDGQNYVYDNKDIYGTPKEQYITSNMYDKQPGFEKPYLFDDNMNYIDIDGDKLLFNRNRNQRSSGGMSQYDLDNQSLVSDQIDNTDMMSMNDFRKQFSRQQLDEAMNKKNELLKQKTSHGKAKTAVKGEKSFNEIVDDLKNIVSNYDETGKPLPLNKQTQGDRVKASADNILSEFEKIFGKKRAK